MSISLGVHVGQQNMAMDDMRALWRKLDSSGADWAVIDVGGVGYLVFCTARTLNGLAMTPVICSITASPFGWEADYTRWTMPIRGLRSYAHHSPIRCDPLDMMRLDSLISLDSGYCCR